MLLLKKKKYAAITTHEDKTGAITFQDEMKGLDLVRRDWCIQSKKSGRYILMDCIFSGEEKVSERAKRSERALMNTRIREYEPLDVCFGPSLNNPLAPKDAPGRTSHRVQF